ncbi:hypothetical protein COK05_12005 [Bacillus cereus]|uniref:Uncharacterized protein n=1 Tax=Bacillus cereus TaxID=1396 RepID=A0A2B2LP39_BACCE|nr:hypothetical protein COK05_12005 [Bacillus cereus]
MSLSVSICNGTSNKIGFILFLLSKAKNNKYIFNSLFRNPFLHIEDEATGWYKKIAAEVALSCSTYALLFI